MKRAIIKPNGVAACSLELQGSGSTIQLLPAGQFRSRDTRPADVAAWSLTEALAEKLITAAQQRKTPYVIDYEHQTLRSAESGQPAPAAGWFTKLEWRDGGLYAVDVAWTEKAKAMIDAKEYRYISPVFSYDPRSGAVTSLVMAAITNLPGLDGMSEILAAATHIINQPTEDNTMNKWLVQILAALDLKTDFENDESAAATAALSAITQLTGDAEKLTGLNAQLAALKEQLKTANPDPAKFAPVTLVEELKTQLSTLAEAYNKEKVAALVDQGIEDKKLLPAQRDWAVALGERNRESLQQYLDNAQPIAVLSAGQTKGKPPGDEKKLSDEELAVCTLLGQSEEDFVAAKAAK